MSKQNPLPFPKSEGFYDVLAWMQSHLREGERLKLAIRSMDAKVQVQLGGRVNGQYHVVSTSFYIPSEGTSIRSGCELFLNRLETLRK